MPSRADLVLIASFAFAALTILLAALLALGAAHRGSAPFIYTLF